MAPALFIGWMALVLTTGESTALVSLGLASASSQLWFLAGATALVCLIAAILSFISGMLWRDLAQSVQHEWRTETYAHVQRVELRYLEGERTTRLAGLLTNDINQLGRFFATSADYFLQLATS
ncbi:MAG: ABC transporter transmembrane domain-containing protein, partial [Pseudonocardiaceae bacterium]